MPTISYIHGSSTLGAEQAIYGTVPSPMLGTKRVSDHAPRSVYCLYETCDSVVL